MSDDVACVGKMDRIADPIKTISPCKNCKGINISSRTPCRDFCTKYIKWKKTK